MAKRFEFSVAWKILKSRIIGRAFKMYCALLYPHVKIGRGLVCYHWPNISHFCGDISIGNNVSLGSVFIAVPHGARLTIGDRVRFNDQTYIVALGEITIGNDTIMAEFVTIRDSDHGKWDPDGSTRSPDRIGKIAIGNCVWVARGVAILRDTDVGDRSILGANTVAKGTIPSDTIIVSPRVRVLG